MASGLTLEQLRVLVSVADLGSFSATARQLGRAQSAISQTVKAMEDIQQVKLFDRSRRTPCLTPTGEMLVAQARRIVEQANFFERTTASVAAGVEAHLGVVIDSLTPTVPVIESLKLLRSAFPQLSLTIFTESYSGGVRRLRNQSANVAICTLTPVVTQDLQAHPLTTIELVPVAAPTHPLAKEHAITRERLAEHVQLVLTEPQSPDREEFSVVSPQVWRFLDASHRLEFLLAGFGWCNMPLHLVSSYLAAGGLVRLPIDDLAISPGALTIYAVHERARPLGTAAAKLVEHLTAATWGSHSA